MKVLEITFIPPEKKSGGGLGVYQSIKSLLGNCDVDYIGPKFESGLFENTSRKLSIIEILEERQSGVLVKILRMLLKKVTTSFYDSWKLVERKIDWRKYEFVHIEFSRYDFLVKACHKHEKKCIVRMHNVETDYGKNIFRGERSIFNWLRFISFAVNEKRVLKKADFFVFLTEEDIKRANQIVPLSPMKVCINPVCIESCEVSERSNNEKKVILLTGSLGYGPNAKGVVWYIDRVWNKLNKLEMFENVSVIVAGAHPTVEVKECINNSSRVRLVDTPEDMAPYFEEASIYIAAVFEGAGMKVKVGEALSYGLPVIGTSHAFIGYDNINVGKYVADTEEAFCEHLMYMCDGFFNMISKKEIRAEFIDKLSMKSSINRYKEIMIRLEEIR
ncbi:MAG: glycosyltransferase family 4 protein [Lachnospiraceae bacterium]|nr:glycosyltransferase family 4 protein [Lachnospiraceae bacterium]